ncbi:MAG: endonuclease [Sphingobacteriia bacterium]|jgi:predicted extracellular nuclease|nr:endonuclease [Paludibacteraceae bacterium]NCA79414.1 endonuclease [Sphingobacteriia bacterium]
MKRYYWILFILLCCCIPKALPQSKPFRVVCYNVENLFDIRDDSLTNDSEYLQGGKRGWTYKKYNTKLSNISKVITAIGGWNPPAIVGLCEIENRHVLEDLTCYAPLKAFHYQIVHYESPDARGVDVGLLYQKNRFCPIFSEAINITFPDNPEKKTRDILYVKGVANNSDTLHIFVNHFPSRLGGALASEPRRIYVASVLRHKVDSLLQYSPTANILIMGDFNDYPTNKSISQTLRAMAIPTDSNIINDTCLYNLFYHTHVEGVIGSYKHDGEWGMLDQMIVSGNLLHANTTSIVPNSAEVFDAEWLLEEDRHYLGKQPSRTYIGMKFNNGYSDHLPIFVDFSIKPSN